jgi:hypothetical protein
MRLSVGIRPEGLAIGLAREAWRRAWSGLEVEAARAGAVRWAIAARKALATRAADSGQRAADSGPVGREIRWGGLWWLVDGSGNGGDSECGLVGGCRLLAAGCWR